MAEKCSIRLDVPSYMVDRRYLHRPGSFMDLAQEMAMIGAREHSFGDDRLAAHSSVWVLARMQVRFLRPVRREDKVCMSTWHKGVQGVFFVRDYSLDGEDGQPSVVSTSSWIVMDINTRRAVRSDRLTDIIPTEAESTDNAVEELAPKVALPRGSEPVKAASKRICYSDVDYNHHANNAKYVVWAMDCLPDETVYGHSVKELSINFNKEARPGETVDLYTLESDGAWYVEGRIQDQQIFIVRLVFD